MIIFINVDKIIFINTTVIGRRICYTCSYTVRNFLQIRDIQEHYAQDLIHNSARSHPHSARSHPQLG
jgi:hypothetical protein